jgi:hypothetical protein
MFYRFSNCTTILCMIANYSINLIIYVFMNRRETRTAKTIRESFYGLMLMVDTPTRMTSYKDTY